MASGGAWPPVWMPLAHQPERWPVLPPAWRYETNCPSSVFWCPVAFDLAVASTWNAFSTTFPWPPQSFFQTQTPPPGSPPEPPVLHHSRTDLAIFLSIQGSASSLILPVTPLLTQG